jgi:hypothetical protein
MSARTVAEVFEKPSGRVTLNDRGRWWSNRTDLRFDAHGRITFQVADGEHTAEIAGTPEQLDRLCASIQAHIASAKANTP